MTRPDVRRWLTATMLSLGLAASTLGAQPASADAATDAPVTKADKVTVWSGSVKTADVLANDSDPQGDPLAVCRVAESPYRNVGLGIEGGGDEGELYVFAGPRAKAGTYVLTYYACDFEYLTPATLTVTVKRSTPVRVTKIEGRPGKLRVVNPNSRRILMMWGDPMQERPDGTLRLPGHQSEVITVERRSIFWFALFPRDGGIAGMGTVRNIALPKVGAGPRVTPLSPGLTRLWNSHR